MDTDFRYDVFLSHSATDKDVVREIAERLRLDGVRVWFDEWEIQPGDSIPAKIEAGLEQSRVLVLCMSAAAFGSDWAQLESYSFRFRDPLNTQRRFLPLRLDDSEIKGSLAQFQYIDWRTPASAPYKQLQTGCQQDRANPWPKATKYGEDEFDQKALSLGHTHWIQSVAISPDGASALSGSEDNTVRLWDIETGQTIRVFEGHIDSVLSVAVSPDGARVLSGSDDNTVRLWDIEAGQTIRVFEGHIDSVLSVWPSAQTGRGRSRAQ